MASTASVSADPPNRRSEERHERAVRTDELLTLLDTTVDEERRRRLHQDLIEINMPVAAAIAARYRRRGIPDEDLEQVAFAALVRVAHSYDHASGHDFLSYAVPSIRGEVRRYFRDSGWMIKPPRRIQEFQGSIALRVSQLATELGRPPTAGDLAKELDAPVRDVEEALAATACFAPTSLDQLVIGGGSVSVADGLGDLEPGFDAADARAALAPALEGLSDRERKIIGLRFFQQWTQQEIADEIGVTQMQVSRLLTGILARLRADICGRRDPAGAAA